MRVAYDYAAENSSDPSTQNGAILVDKAGSIQCYGANCFPMGIRETPERWERPLKYKIVEHAERNACYAAARLGIRTNGLITVCPWAPCPDCARAIIQSGICLLATHKQAYDLSPERWKTEIDLAIALLKEAGVAFQMFDGHVGAKPVRFNSIVWFP